jgi:hypothetical protein
LAKGTEILAYKITLLSAEVRTLRAANKVLSKRCRAKKSRVRQGGALTVEDTQDVLAQKEAEEQARHDKRSEGGRQNEGQPSGRRCGTCRETGHNMRTCQDTIVVLGLSDSE